VLHQSAYHSENGISFRKRDMDYSSVCRRAFSSAATQVRVLTEGIGANHPQIGCRFHIFVSNTGWYEDNVSRSYRSRESWFSAELESCGASVDAKNFVGGAMVVMKSVHTIAPAAAPAIVTEQSLECGSGLSVGRRHRRAVKQHLQGVVRNFVSFGQKACDDLHDPSYINKLRILNRNDARLNASSEAPACDELIFGLRPGTRIL